MEEKIKELLEEIGKIYKKEQENKQAELDAGNLFNIFEILHLEHYETKTHSLILAELLNPQGRHGCKDRFLKVFLEKVLEDENFLNTTNAIVKIEKGIGQLDTDYEQGGRIDILIHDKEKNAIVIENKIYADDQPKQLYRYCRYAQKTYSNYRVLYLTLDGKDPSENSVNGKDITIEANFMCISYQNHIKRWLEECIKVVAEKSNVKNSLNQYLHIIKKLTNQDMETEELETLLSSPENITNVLLIKNTADKAINAYLKEILEPQLQTIAKALNLECEIHGSDWCNQWKEFTFKRNTWETFSINFQFFSSFLKKCNYGFKFLEEQDRKKINEDIKSKAEKLHSKFGGTTSSWWACYKSFEILDWYNIDTITQISNGQIQEKLIGTIKDCIDLAQDIEL